MSLLELARVLDVHELSLTCCKLVLALIEIVKSRWLGLVSIHLEISAGMTPLFEIHLTVIHCYL